MTAKRALCIAVSACIPCVFAQPPPLCTVARYSVVAVPMQPAAINDAGQVAGTTPDHRAAVWTAKGGLKELPLPAGFSHSEALGINGHGHIVGMAYDQSFSRRQPFVFANGDLRLLPGEGARAYHINESQVVAGESLLPDRQKTQPVLWIGNSMRSIGGCCGGSAKSINDEGQAVGDTYDDHGRYYAYAWSEASGLERIGPADRYSSAIAVNNRGHVLIQAVPSVFLFAEGSLHRLTLAPKYPSHAHAINDCDIIVGSFGPFSDADRAFVWEKNAGFQDLNTRIPSAAGWKLESATDINNRGEIVGRGDPQGAEDSGFLLRPVRP